MGKKPVISSVKPTDKLKAKKKNKAKLLNKDLPKNKTAKKKNKKIGAGAGAAFTAGGAASAAADGAVTNGAQPVPCGPADDSGAAAAAALRWVLAPTQTGPFFDSFWEKKPLLVQREKADYYGQLFSTAKLDSILRNENIQFGRNLDVTSYSEGERETHNPAGRAHAPVVWDYYRNGCSVRLLNPQTYCGAVWRLCAALQEYFGCMVGANVYLTPPGTQGFAPHYDDIEAFMLQLEGKKHWRIYAPRPGEELARDSSGNFRPEDVTSPPVLEVTLKAGDLLYFPRGTIHQGRSLPDEHSMHITISCYQHVAWADLLEKMVPVALQTAISEDVEFRRGLPVGFLGHAGIVNDESSSTQRKELLDTARRLVTRLADFLPVDAAVDQMGKQFMRDALPPCLSKDERCRSVHEDGERWADGAVRGQATMDGSTEIKMIRGNVVRLVNEGDELRLYHCLENSRLYQEMPEQYLVIGDDEQADAVSVLLENYPKYTAIDLLPGAEPEAKVAFAAALWEKGMVVTRAPITEEETDNAGS
ncbi:ribosomal oxygenase 1-like isoform X1 [Amphibalanus amphitrite]|uniref:ribosomal oxygenase 1-like isoform X1 n=1 Tax=Amphibalanus amphitrite TaxID=1232801 RepID=UPI001C91AD1F|nr:ribosomal oxygenase 1-like isoform X1 [Amphibalanus amphitrite]XP_043188226.1 ribosomal oxygenase 1-like isoform X1 [Amphibalanus amphitrite]XP_043188227.1 ribosomal oxygenase 1-like isoform X1 [Amphibalanus amphitrite]